MVLLYKDKFLFSGDHLHFDREENHLEAYREVCWYSWTEQTRSMKELTHYSFEWVLAGHGDRVHLAQKQMLKQLGELVERMHTTG
jgi:glyoxylase-like metal-dependent hydrolase (beta-lactamase superfamily II)